MANEKRLTVANELAERVSGIGIHFVGLRNGQTLVKEAMEKYRDAVLRTIYESPTVDAVEVVHGRWKKTAYSGVSRCSCCDKPSSTPDCLDEFFNYCPNCGAKMDGGNEDE